MQTYLFYDIETTGLNKSFDQVLQFAAIRTNLLLEEKERFDIKIKLNPDVIPSPKALITHRIGIANPMDAVSEYEGIHKIHRLLNEPGTISLGYNSLNFDDEFLRFSFYRNLLPPYTHQYANQCGRMDLYPMTVMYFLFKKEHLSWPKKSLKLEELNACNQWIQGRSHHAMTDVEVTLALAREFYKDRAMWDYVASFFNKYTEQKRCRTLNSGLLIDGSLGSEKNYQAPILLLGTHKHYQNQSIWLRLDSSEFSKEDLTHYKFVIKKKWGEPNFIVPLDAKFTQNLPEELNIHASKNQNWFSAESDLRQKITNHHLESLYPIYPKTDAQASLYLRGFWSVQEEMFCKRFHEANPETKVKMIEQVENPQLKTLATRIIARNFPEFLTPKLKEHFENYLNDLNSEESVIDFKGARALNSSQAKQDIAKLRIGETLDTEQKILLDDLEKYVTE